MILGAHVSTAGGLPNAIENAKKLGVKSFQIFPWSPRMWAPRAIPDVEVRAFKDAFKNEKMHSCVIHMVYLANPASNNSELYKKSLSAILSTVNLAARINAYGICFHLGANKDRKEGIEKIVNAIDVALAALKNQKTYLMLEPASGAQSSVSRFEDVQKIIKATAKDERVGVILDTCHTYAAGYDWVGDSGFNKTIGEIKSSFGFTKIKALHLNDSMYPRSSNRDRHENIGQGHIGIKGFKKIMKIKEFKNLPGLLETPGFDHTGPDAKNLEVLNELS